MSCGLRVAGYELRVTSYGLRVVDCGRHDFPQELERHRLHLQQVLLTGGCDIRQSIRLKGYDYTWPGWYFVTIATAGRECFFGDVVGGVMKPSRLGETADSMWREIPKHHQKVKLDIHQFMPDHMHGIIILGHDELKFAEGRDVFKDPRRDVSKDTRRDVQLNVPPESPLNVPPHLHSLDEDDIHVPWDECTNVPLGVNFPDNALLYNFRKKRSIGKEISPPKDSLSVVIRTFKGAVTTWARDNGIPEFRWHERFHEKILRDENHLYHVRRYIFNNPRNWKPSTRTIRGGI